MKSYLKKNIQWVLFFTLICIWGSSFILMKKALISFTPLQLGNLRMSFAALVLLPFAFKGIREVSLRQWKYLFLVGFMGNSIPAVLFALAQSGIDSSLAGILNATTPFFVMLVGVSFFKLKVRFINVIGLLLGLIGAIEIIGLSGIGGFQHNFKYAVYILISTILYAINLNILKFKIPEMNSSKITILSLSMVGVPSMIYILFFSGFFTSMQAPKAMESLIAVGILGITCSSLALLMYYRLMQISSMLFAASVTYFIPIVALIFGILDGEMFRASNFIWIALIIVGVYLVNKKVPLQQ